MNKDDAYVLMLVSLRGVLELARATKTNSDIWKQAIKLMEQTIADAEQAK